MKSLDEFIGRDQNTPKSAGSDIETPIKMVPFSTGERDNVRQGRVPFRIVNRQACLVF